MNLPNFRPKFHPDRFAEAVRLHAVFNDGFKLTYDRGFWIENNETRQQYPFKKKWVSRGQGTHYPVWRAPWGGTRSLMLFNVIQWARQLPVPTIRSWEYWCSKTVGVNRKCLEIAKEIGWPETVPCCMCGRELVSGDWYDWKSHGIPNHGLGCWYTEGCKGAIPEGAKRK